MLNDTYEAVEAVIAENEHLRMLVVNLQREGLHSRLLATARQADCESLRHAREDMERQLDRLGRQLSRLTKQHVIARRLHETCRREEVLDAIADVVTNVVGSDRLVVFERHGADLALVVAAGVDAARYATVPPGRGAIGRTAVTGRVWLRSATTSDPDEPARAACLPLVFDGCVGGVIAIFDPQPPEPELAAIDREILDLLATHAAIALMRRPEGRA
jgi:hypothetical protein